MEKREMDLDRQSENMQLNYVLIKFALFYVCIYIYIYTIMNKMYLYVHYDIQGT